MLSVALIDVVRPIYIAALVTWVWGPTQAKAIFLANTVVVTVGASPLAVEGRFYCKQDKWWKENQTFTLTETVTDWSIRIFSIYKLSVQSIPPWNELWVCEWIRLLYTVFGVVFGCYWGKIKLNGNTFSSLSLSLFVCVCVRESVCTLWDCWPKGFHIPLLLQLSLTTCFVECISHCLQRFTS